MFEKGNKLGGKRPGAGRIPKQVIADEARAKEIALELLARHLMPIIDTALKVCKGIRRGKFYPVHILEDMRKTRPKARNWYHEIEYDTAMIRFWIERFAPAAKQGIDLAVGSPEEYSEGQA
jgi:hypothetical protein